MPTILTANFRLIAAVAALIVAFIAGDHYRGMVDKVESDRQYRQEQEANAKAQAELNRKAKAAESQLAAFRMQAANIEIQWEKERHDESHASCALSAATVSVLKSASQ